ncbi:SGNH/GDSL hydrolase family protein [Nigerium massiliense]|uniref:hypothetical protein n=1 Tax=Nigerium massiliense TaxID=1522317 RepID=UPI001C45727C|nr:hypothetical protein [Nigerium massiliense]
MFDRPRGPIGPKFEGAQNKAHGLADAYREVCVELGCAFFDANTVTGLSKVDGVHLDADQHETLGKALSQPVLSLLGT